MAQVLSSRVAATSALPQPVGRTHEHALIGGHETNDVAAPALLESIDAVKRVAPRGCLELRHLRCCAILARASGHLHPAARVGDAEEVPRARAALLGP